MERIRNFCNDSALYKYSDEQKLTKKLPTKSLTKIFS